MKEIIIEIGEERYVFEFENGPSVPELKAKVKQLVSEEEMVMCYTGQVPVLSSLHKKTNTWTQVHNGQIIGDGQTIRVTFRTPPAAHTPADQCAAKQPLATVITPTPTSPPTPAQRTQPSVSEMNQEDNGMDQEIVLTGEGQVRVMTMTGDGSCMFTAILKQLNPDMTKDELKVAAKALRTDVVKYIKKHMKDFENTILMSVEASGCYHQKYPRSRMNAFMNNLEKGVEWGGYETLVACSKIKEVSIKVLQEVWQDNFESATSIHIEYSEGKGDKPQTLTIVYRISQDPEEREKKYPKRNHYDSFLGYIADNDNHCENDDRKKKKDKPCTPKSTILPMFNSDSTIGSSEFEDTSDDQIYTEDELLKCYAPGQWEDFPSFHKKTEKQRWALYLQVLANEENKSSGKTVPPFQGHAPLSEEKKKKRRKRNRKQARNLLSDFDQIDKLKTPVKEHSEKQSNTDVTEKLTEKTQKPRKQVKRDIEQITTTINNETLEEQWSPKSTPVNKMVVNSGGSTRSPDFSSSSFGFEQSTSDDLLDTDAELLDYYTFGQWESFPSSHKKSEKRRWALYLQEYANEEERKSGKTVTPFEGRAPPSKEKKKRRRKRNKKRTRNQVSDSESPEQLQTSTNEDELSRGHDQSSAYRRVINSSDEANQSKKEPSKKLTKKKPKPRKIVKRDHGEQLTAANCLPELSELSKQSLDQRNPDWRAILPDFRAHLHGLIGNDYPSRNEYQIICSSFIKEYPCTADADNPQGFSQLKLKLRKSLSQKEHYETTGKENRLAARANKENTQPIVVVKAHRTQNNLDELDKQLQEADPNVESNRMKNLILQTYKNRSMKFKMQQQGAEGAIELWTTYPHLTSYHMLSYEYSLLIRKTYVDLASNFKKVMEKLKIHYHIEDTDNLTEIKILEKVYEEITPINYRKIGMVPALDIQDEYMVKNGPGQDQNEKNSPRVLVMTRYGDEGKDVTIWSWILGSGKVLSKCEKPGALEVTIQLLAAYFIMDLKYPNSYKSFLRFLEKFTNDGLSLQTLKQDPHDTYSRFMRKTGLQEMQCFPSALN